MTKLVYLTRIAFYPSPFLTGHSIAYHGVRTHKLDPPARSSSAAAFAGRSDSSKPINRPPLYHLAVSHSSRPFDLISPPPLTRHSNNHQPDNNNNNNEGHKDDNSNDGGNGDDGGDGDTSRLQDMPPVFDMFPIFNSASTPTVGNQFQPILICMSMLSSSLLWLLCSSISVQRLSSRR